VAVSDYWYGPGPIGCPTPIKEVLALHLGNACGPQPTPGITITYSVTVPPYGAGNIAMAQIVNINFSGLLNNQKVYFTPGPGLDYQFPYGTVEEPAGTPLSTDDSPAYYVGQSTCSTVTLSESFTDYFMYEPTATSQRPSIWVSDYVGTWPKWSGTANYSKSKWSLAHGSVSPKPTSSPPNSAIPAWANWFRNPVFPC
jgi:hypothetical protein